MTTKLYYYSTHNGILREATVIRETDRMYIVEETADSATRISKNDGRLMRNGDSFFFVDREAAVSHLINYCRFKVKELRQWEIYLAELTAGQGEG